MTGTAKTIFRSPTRRTRAAGRPARVGVPGGSRFFSDANAPPHLTLREFLDVRRNSGFQARLEWYTCAPVMPLARMEAGRRSAHEEKRHGSSRQRRGAHNVRRAQGK